MFKLRFGKIAGSANHDERRYKRKSSAQVRRDKERSAAWRNERLTPTHNAETVPQCSGGVSAGANAGDSQTFGVRTRSQKLHDQEEADLEQPRCADDSPAPVMDITLPSPDISSSILNPSAECFTLDISPRTPVMSPLSRDGEQTNCNLLSPGSTSFVSSGASVHSDTSDDENDTESEDRAPVTSDCRSRRCKFGGYGFADKMHTFLYWCGKCKFHVCCDCWEKGVHSRHQHHMTKRYMTDCDM